MASFCGTGTGNFPQPGDPDLNNSILNAVPAFGGIDVFWTYPELNSFAVAYTNVYRSTNADPATRVKLRRASGEYFYDKVNPSQNITYYYWIQIVSVNGTIGDFIGPASVVARPTIEQTIELVSGRINKSSLADALRTDIDRIGLVEEMVELEKLGRVEALDDLGVDIARIDTGLDGVGSLLQSEVTRLDTEDSAQLQQINTLAAQADDNAALIQSESTVRANADSALAQQITAYQAAVNENLASIEETYETSVDADTARATLQENVEASISTQVAASIEENNTSRIGFCMVNGAPDAGIDNRDACNATPGGTWLELQALSEAVKGVQIDDGEGGSGSVQQKMTSYRDALGDIQSMYTLKVQIDPNDSTQGIIKGGLGIGANESTGLVDAGFDVDTFWVGKLGQKTLPFIIDSNTGETFIDEAVIQSLTFNKMRSEDGTLAFTPTVYDGLGNVTEAGKLKVSFIDVDNLTATQAQSSNFVTGSAGWKLFADGSAELQDVTVRGDVEATSLKADTLMVDEGHIVDASVDTLQIKGRAVTFLQAQSGGSGYLPQTLLSFTFNHEGDSNEDCLISFGGECTADNTSGKYSYLDLKLNGSTVETGSKDPTTGWGAIALSFVQSIPTGNNTITLALRADGFAQAKNAYQTVVACKR